MAMSFGIAWIIPPDTAPASSADLPLNFAMAALTFWLPSPSLNR